MKAHALWFKGKKSIHEFLFKPVSPLPLAYMRIGIASLLLIQALVLGEQLFAFFGQRGIIQLELNDYLSEFWLPTVNWFYKIFNYFGISYNNWVSILYIVYLMALTGLLLGWHTRLFAIMSWFFHFSLFNSNGITNYGVDQFNHIMLFYFTWMPISQALSWDQKLGRVSSLPTANATISLRLIQCHLCVVYLAAGLGKAQGTTWWNGEAIWRALMLPEYYQYDFSWLVYVPWLAKLICWGTLIVETFYPIFIWPHKTRFLWVAATVAMHLGIGAFQGLSLFAGVMILLTACAFGTSYTLAGASDEPRQSSRDLLRVKRFKELSEHLPIDHRLQREVELILFDGDCGVCNRFVQHVLKHDKEQKFYFAPLSSAIGTYLLGNKNNLSTVVYINKEGVFYRSRAILMILQKVDSRWSQLAKHGEIIPSGMSDIFYWFFAKIRQPISQILLKRCVLPTHAERQRFLSQLPAICQSLGS